MMDTKQETIEVDQCWFELIKSGDKQVEGKKANERWSKIKIGDVVNIVNSKKKEDKFQMKVVKLNKYKTIEEYLKTETLERTLPGVKTIKDGEKVYMDYWDSEKDKKELETYGVLAIVLEKV